MKKVKPLEDQEEEYLPFSFFKNNIDNEKIKAHWQKIKEKIESADAGSKNKKDDNNQV